MTRMQKLLLLGWAACCVLVVTRAAAENTSQRPNVLLILTDQQHAGMMSCTGNPNLKTPAMDALASRGVRFEKAYCANPVCVPSRFSIFSGHYPSATGIRHNGDKRRPVPKRFADQALGWLFRRAGYETVYGGKVHLPTNMSIKAIGFDRLTSDQRDELANKCAEYLRRKHNKPFLLVASFINPHDICYMALRNPDLVDPSPTGMPRPMYEAMQPPAGVSLDIFVRDHCPPLPANLEPPRDEPQAITLLLKKRPFRIHARQSWSDAKWRVHRWAYCRMTERVDSQIAVVLRALEDAGLANNTLVVFTSDHGDMDSAHRMEHKTAFYEEAVRIPLIVSYPNVAHSGHVDRTHLVSNGLDLIPTLCDYAGIAPPKDLAGRSLRPLLQGKPPAGWRKQLLVESEIGVMLHTGRYKYCRYDEGARNEQLIDLKTDPGEMRNLAASPSHTATLTRLRATLTKSQQ